VTLITAKDVILQTNVQFARLVLTFILLAQLAVVLLNILGALLALRALHALLH
jgi:hypothetical protein